MSRLFGTNGVRGVLNQTLTVTTLVKLGYAVGTYFKGGKILVGRDGRLGSPIARNAVVSGLLATGCDVLDLGLAPTPTIQYEARFQEVDGCVIVTASHNPPEFVGVKVCGPDGVEVRREEEAEIEDIFFGEKFNLVGWDRVGCVRRVSGAIERYIEGVLKQVNREEIGKRRFRVVVDPGNGVTALTTPYILRKLGCEVYTINGHIDGSFPGRLPEPSEENLGSLVEAVKAFDADLGVAHDGDGDRAIFVDEKAVLHPGDRTLALVEDYVMSITRGATLVTPVSTSQAVEEIAEKRGGRVLWVRVGSVDVSWTMKATKAELGGEENGGVFYGPHQPVRDGGMTTALILHILAVRGETLSEALSTLPAYRIVKRKVRCPDTVKDKVLKILEEKVSGERVEKIDGLKIWFKGRRWVLVRPSGTEPIYRVIAEAPSRREAESLADKYVALVNEAVEEASQGKFNL